MRTIALAEEAAERGLRTTYVVDDDPVAQAIVADRGFAQGRGDDVSWMASVAPGDAVVFDGYRFGAADFSAAAAVSATVVAVTDRLAGDFPVDLVINQNLSDHTAFVGARAALVGPRFALVRHEFRAHRRQRSGGSRRLVVTIGGTDPSAVMRRILAKLREGRPFDQVMAVVGPGATLDGDWHEHQSWLQVVTAPGEFAATVDEADAVVSAAGTTTWELLSMGMPVALVQVAENQQVVASGVDRAGAALVLGPTDHALEHMPDALEPLADPVRQAELSRRALALVDGQGPARVLGTILNVRRDAR
jgi:spore coat polysaccharide biosynthesis predicted glycosyltransferase SpsG